MLKKFPLTVSKNAAARNCPAFVQPRGSISPALNAATLPIIFQQCVKIECSKNI